MGCGGSKAQKAGKPKTALGGEGGGSSKNNGSKGIRLTPDGAARIVMQKYRMGMAKDDVMGEGSSSMCRKGTNSETGEALGIKVYKATAKAGSKQEDVMMFKFRRQIEVLKSLQEPFKEVTDKVLWCDALAASKPSSLFMILVDYSQDSNGNPAQDPDDGVVYVITELAQYSLKDYLALRREQCRPLPKESVRSITRAVVLVLAGLHAKGLAHLDMKPENLMMFNGRLKLIDVDGCVKLNSTVAITDSSISFSPCYCAPEWAEFLINEGNSGIKIAPALDVWSVGMTVCEFVTLNAVLKPMYGNFLRNSHSHREAGFLFMDWLSNSKKVPLPKTIEKFDPDFFDLVQNWLLVCDKTARKSCAQSLSHPYLQALLKDKAVAKDIKAEDMDMTEKDVARTNRFRSEDTSNTAPLYKGTLWKLNSNGDPKDNAHWLKRDMWLVQQGSLCYFSVKENKRLVLVDGSKLADAKITQFVGGAKDHAFEIKYQCEESENMLSLVFACESADEYKNWTSRMMSAARMDLPTMQLGQDMHELRKFIVTVKNRRQKVDDAEKDQFAPVFKDKLWKLKAEGDRLKPEDWFERDMWIAKNGSLVYYSKKEERDLVYYTSADLLRATYTQLPSSESHKPWTFLVHLPQSGDVDFAPGEFAADTQKATEQWITEFKKFSAGGGK